MDTLYDPRPDLRASLQQRLHQAQEAIGQGDARQLTRLQYEYELALRLLGKATDLEERQYWLLEAGVLREMAGMKEDSLDIERREIAHYEAMIAEIEADLAQGK